VVRQLQTLSGEGIKPGGEVPRFGAIVPRGAQVLKKDAEIAVAEVVAKDEDDIRLSGGYPRECGEEACEKEADKPVTMEGGQGARLPTGREVVDRPSQSACRVRAPD